MRNFGAQTIMDAYIRPLRVGMPCFKAVGEGVLSGLVERLEWMSTRRALPEADLVAVECLLLLGLHR